MFEMTMSVSSWAKLGRLLIFDLDWKWVIFFSVYGWIVIFAIIRVISAMFLKQTLAAAAADPQAAMAEKTAKKARDVRHLRAIFERADVDENGLLSRLELESL